MRHNHCINLPLPMLALGAALVASPDLVFSITVFPKEKASSEGGGFFAGTSTVTTWRVEVAMRDETTMLAGVFGTEEAAHVLASKCAKDAGLDQYAPGAYARYADVISVFIDVQGEFRSSSGSLPAEAYYILAYLKNVNARRSMLLAKAASFDKANEYVAKCRALLQQAADAQRPSVEAAK